MSLTIDEVNSLTYEKFTQVFGNVIEHCPVIVASIWDKQISFEGTEDLHRAICNAIDALPVNVQVGILRCHPDLAGKMARSGELSNESKNEQKSCGLDTLTLEEQNTLDIFNDKYKTKFEFPFVICVRQNKKESILKGIQQRVQNSLEEETKIGIGEVKKIGYLRLCNIIKN